MIRHWTPLFTITLGLQIGYHHLAAGDIVAYLVCVLPVTILLSVVIGEALKMEDVREAVQRPGKIQRSEALQFYKERQNNYHNDL